MTQKANQMQQQQPQQQHRQSRHQKNATESWRSAEIADETRRVPGFPDQKTMTNTNQLLVGMLNNNGEEMGDDAETMAQIAENFIRSNENDQIDIEDYEYEDDDELDAADADDDYSSDDVNIDDIYNMKKQLILGTRK